MTTDGGNNFARILVTSQLPFLYNHIESIKSSGQRTQIELEHLRGTTSIVSEDRGRSWKCQGENGRTVETYDGGMTWGTAEELAAEAERIRRQEEERQRLAIEAEQARKKEAERIKQQEVERQRLAAEAEQRRKNEAERIKKQEEERHRLAADTERERQQVAELKRQEAEAEIKRLDEAKWRDWSANIGRAKFVTAIGTNVQLLKEDGTTVTISTRALSADDQYFIKNRLWRAP
jgi:chromosome segregation ATPase